MPRRKLLPILLGLACAMAALAPAAEADEQVAAVSPEAEPAAAPDGDVALFTAARAALASAGEAVGCDSVSGMTAGPVEHPAYSVVSALCNGGQGRARLVTVRLMQSGRAAVRAEGTVSLTEDESLFRAF